MSTLAEIASAAKRLPIHEQQELVRQLTRKPRVQPRILSLAERQAWVARLAKEARASSTGRHTISVDQIIDELREERC